MRKPHNFTELSKHRCRNCNKRLKMNLIAKNPKADKCYVCWRFLVRKLTHMTRKLKKSTKSIDLKKAIQSNRVRYRYKA